MGLHHVRTSDSTYFVDITRVEKFILTYLGALVRVSDLPGQRRLRSASTDRLVVPPFKLSTIVSRTFNVAAARTQNGLPEDMT